MSNDKDQLVETAQDLAVRVSKRQLAMMDRRERVHLQQAEIDEKRLERRAWVEKKIAEIDKVLAERLKAEKGE